MSRVWEDVVTGLAARYRARTERSAALYERAREVEPGGDSRTTIFFAPHPLFARRGQGPRLEDVDGNVYLDCLNNYTALVHGHAHPAVAGRIAALAAEGTAFAAKTAWEVDLAAELCGRVASVERVRFTNSGTEAVMLAVRAARAFTGRARIAKVEGAYHGTYDGVHVSVAPAVAGDNPPDRPRAVPEGAGIPPAVLGQSLVLPFNDPGAARAILAAHAGDLAAVIVEPFPAHLGYIAPEPGYLEALRALTREMGALLIFDEVQSFRLARGGGQALVGVEPDLTAFGKVIGGGLPVGAVGGRAAVMRVFDPAGGTVPHGGTFNANPMTMAAGLAALELLDAQAFAHLDRLGARLRSGLRAALEAHGLRGCVTGVGSLLQVHLGPERVTSYRGVAQANRELHRAVHLGLLLEGVLTAPDGMLNASTVMTSADADAVVEAYGRVLAELAGPAREAFPELRRAA